MKRSRELRDLSEQHHYGLVAARRLRLAGEETTPLDEEAARFLEEWRGEIEPHFRVEEELLLPAFARALPANAGENSERGRYSEPQGAYIDGGAGTGSRELIARTVAEHASLRRAVGDLARAAGDDQRSLAREIGQALHDHIRFEERVLFPAVEAALAGTRLAELGQELTERKDPDEHRLCDRRLRERGDRG
jgi:iron-sulfur cluster repair protein YtfE (RIC family)